jgi:tetratricopeptide (TPR) repeat protein
MTLLGFVPVLNLVRIAAPLDMGSPMAERFCYLPSFPFAGLVGVAAAALWVRLSRPAARAVMAAAVAAVLVAGVAASRARSELWTDHLVLVRALHESAPEATLPAVLLAEALAERGRLAEAGSLLDRVEETNAHEPSVLAARATWLVLQERWADAVPVQRRLVSGLTRSNGLGESNLAFLLLHSGEVAEAEKLLERTVAAHPGIPEAWFNLGDLRRRQGRHEDARASLRRALALSPAEPRFAAALAALELSAGRPDAAEAVYEELLEVRGPEPAVLNNLAAVRAQAGRPAAAIEALEQALRLDPGSVRARLNLARMLAAAGRSQEARVELEKVAALAEPDSVEARLAREGLAAFSSVPERGVPAP